jgi:hypothetical protein
MQSGRFLTPTFSGYDSTGTGITGIRPDRIGGGSLPDNQRSLNRWFDASAFIVPGANPATPFTPPGAPIGRFGNSGTGIITGPGVWDTGVSVGKLIPLGERMRLNLYAFANNVFNHLNPGDPSLDLSSPVTVGTITSVRTKGSVNTRKLVLYARFEF